MISLSRSGSSKGKLIRKNKKSWQNDGKHYKRLTAETIQVKQNERQQDDGLLFTEAKLIFDVVSLYFKQLSLSSVKFYVHHLGEMSPSQVMITKAKVISCTLTGTHELVKISLLLGSSNTISGHLNFEETAIDLLAYIDR